MSEEGGDRESKLPTDATEDKSDSVTPPRYSSEKRNGMLSGKERTMERKDLERILFGRADVRNLTNF